MPKGYWIACYRQINDADALARYAKAAGPVIEAGGGRMIVRGIPQKSYEAGKAERTVVVEFDSVERAISTYESDAYRAVLKLLDGAVERDVRMIEGLG